MYLPLVDGENQPRMPDPYCDFISESTSVCICFSESKFMLSIKQVSDDYLNCSGEVCVCED